MKTAKLTALLCSIALLTGLVGFTAHANASALPLDPDGYEASTNNTGPRWIEVKGGAWHLGEGELMTMQRKLHEFFAAPQDTQSSPAPGDPFGIRKTARAAAEKKQIAAAWTTYSIQYQGESKLEGQFVKIEANCNIGTPTWLHDTFAQVSDGGTCVFNVKYNPVTQQFFDFEVNGYA